MARMLAAPSEKHMDCLRKDWSALFTGLFNRTKTHKQAFRLFELRYSIPGGLLPDEYLKKIIDERVDDSKSQEVTASE